MTTLVLSALVFAASVAGMSLGLLFGRAPIRSGCRGAGLDCAGCARPCDRQESREEGACSAR